MNSQRAIVRILAVVDTRAFEEVSRNGRDAMAPIPGSGDLRECDRCGRQHEVHAHVELDNGDTVTVGTGCMKRDAMAPELRRMAARATKTAANAAALAKVEARIAVVLAIRAEVAALPAPEVVETPAAADRVALRAGDAMVFAFSGADRADRIDVLRQEWRRLREQERGVKLCELEGLKSRRADLLRRSASK